VIQSFKTELKNSIKENEIKLTAFIVEHNIPISVIDYLIELFK